MIDFNTRRKHLTCGCCGTWFKTWLGYRDQDQDRGYGICRDCQIDDAWRDYEMMSNLIDRFADALSESNREIWLAMDRPGQEVIIHKALEDGIITFGFRRSA